MYGLIYEYNAFIALNGAAMAMYELANGTDFTYKITRKSGNKADLVVMKYTYQGEENEFIFQVDKIY